MDLSTLDPTQPPGSQAVSLGDDRIRETRDAVLTSFGLEHHLTGEHKIAQGDQGARPAAGKAGRLYLNIADKRLEFDIGTAWEQIGLGSGLNQFVSGTTALTPSYLALATFSVDQPFNGAYFVLGRAQIAAGSFSGLVAVRFRATLDGSPFNPVADGTFYSIEANRNYFFTPWFFGASLISGAHTIAIEGKLDSAAPVTMKNREMLVVTIGA